MAQLFPEQQHSAQQKLAQQLFEQQFQRVAELVCYAPGRVNYLTTSYQLH